ncbi:MAG: cation:proton antiporter, partial [Alphaproteobacteria bacterium]|nr:cation:proton antiporter [Alphaproteobacteria bacterium]
MIAADDFLAPARALGFDFYSGVPCSFLAPLITLRARRLRVPAIVLEILLGIALGRSGLGLVDSSQVIEFL